MILRSLLAMGIIAVLAMFPKEALAKPITVFVSGQEYASFEDYQLERIKQKIQKMMAELSNKDFDRYLDNLMITISSHNLTESHEQQLQDYIDYIKMQNFTGYDEPKQDTDVKP